MLSWSGILGQKKKARGKVVNERQETHEKMDVFLDERLKQFNL